LRANENGILEERIDDGSALFHENFHWSAENAWAISSDHLIARSRAVTSLVSSYRLSGWARFF
jgi:hypothetical protein